MSEKPGPKPSPDGARKQVHVSIPVKLLARLDTRLAELDIDRSAFFQQAARELLGEHDPKETPHANKKPVRK